jgi:hypothetical protein
MSCIILSILFDISIVIENPRLVFLPIFSRLIRNFCNLNIFSPAVCNPRKFNFLQIPEREFKRSRVIALSTSFVYRTKNTKSKRGLKTNGIQRILYIRRHFCCNNRYDCWSSCWFRGFRILDMFSASVGLVEKTGRQDRINTFLIFDFYFFKFNSVQHKKIDKKTKGRKNKWHIQHNIHQAILVQ